MAFKGNPFALLEDDDDGDVSPFLHPHHSPEPEKPAKPHDVRSETRRGRERKDRGRGSGKNNGTDVERLGHGQQNGMQKNQERENNYHQSNGYRRYNWHSDGYRESRGRAYGYQQQNRGDNGSRKNDVYEQNNADSTKPYVKDFSNKKDFGTEQGQWHTIVGGRGRRSNEKNEFTNQDQVIEGNQQHESKWPEKDSSGSQEKLAGGKFYRGDVNHFRNGRSSGGGERRGDRQNNRGNWVAMRGDGEVKTSEKKETRDGNEEIIVSGEKPISMKGKVTAGISKEEEPKQNGQEVPTGNDSKEGTKEQKENIMTLQEYEKQLLEKRKTLEALRKQERKVTLDKDLESMQLVGRKKENFSLFKRNSEKEKLKKDGNLEEDEKLRKVCGTITRAWYQGRGRGCGRGPGGGYRAYSSAATTKEDEAPETGDSHEISGQTPYVEDLDQFPGLGNCGSTTLHNLG